MSDRPVRLKYLTKMKIILCIFLPCITAVSVFSKSQELHGIVGKSIEFTYAVKTAGSLFYDSKAYGASAIGAVKNGNFAPQNENFRDRLQWDSSTGHFSLSELRLNDSGIYKVQNDGQKSVSFSLTVWKEDLPVLKPHVSITHNEYPCTIECTAERGTGVTLSWYREGQEKPYVSSRVASAPYLHLPQTVERSGTYTCELKNSVSNETSDPLTVEPLCTAPSGPSTGTIVLSLLVAVLLVTLIVVFIYFRCYLVRRLIKDNQALVEDVVRRLIKDNQALVEDDEENQALIKGAVETAIQELHGPSERDDEPETEKGWCAIL